MPDDRFPAEEQRIIRQLQRDMEQLKLAARTVAALPITRASGPFTVPDGAPSTPSSGVTLYGSSGDFRARTSSGDIISLPGAAVSDHTITSSSVSNPPTQAQVNAIRTDVVNLSNEFNNLLTSLRNAGVID